jgi:hypothetical protein
MNDLDRRLDEILRDETSVGTRTFPAGSDRRIGRRHASLVAAVCAGVLAGLALLVVALGPLTGRSSRAPSPVPATQGVAGLAGYEQPAGWPTVDFASEDRFPDVLGATDESMKDPVVLAAGTVDGSGFGVVTYEPGPGSDEQGTCGSTIVGAIFAAKGSFGSTPFCTEGWFIRVPEDRDMLAGTQFESRTDTFETFSAIVSDRVASVVATMDDGTVAEFPTIAGPPGSPIDLAVFFAPFGLGGHVEALDADGDVLDRASVCIPPQVKDGTMGAGDSIGCTGSPAELRG